MRTPIPIVLYGAGPRSILEANAWVRGQMTDTLTMKLGGGASITGASTSAGWNVVAALTYFFEPANRPGFRPSSARDEETSKFREETQDGVNQELFEAPRPPPPPLPPSPEEQRKKLQKELDKTEMQIELKKAKPKRRK